MRGAGLKGRTGQCGLALTGAGLGRAEREGGWERGIPPPLPSREPSGGDKEGNKAPRGLA